MMETLPATVLSATALAIGYQHGDSTRCIASGLDLALQAGEFVCLLGPNGTGKSTLIRSLSGMQAPLSGVIRIAGCEFHRIPPRQRARLVSVVLTETLPPGMMDENVQFVKPDLGDEFIRADLLTGLFRQR